MGNHWSGPHPWPSERKTFVEACWKAPGRTCPKCGRAVRFLYAPFQYGPLKFAPVFQEPADPTQEDWACRFCHRLVYSSQYPQVWENDHKRTLAQRLERFRQFREQYETKQLRRAERNWKRYQKALKQLEKSSVS